MKWAISQEGLEWPGEITNRAAKERVAQRIAERLTDGDVVGVGSGSTSFLSLRALAERSARERLAFVAIPTSIEVSMACDAMAIQTASLRTMRPDWSFDGADEVDPDGNMIKGRGGAIFREKLLMASSPEIHIVADPSKMVARLGERHAIPVEVDPDAVSYFEHQMRDLPGLSDVRIRRGAGKDGPVITEKGNVLLDVRSTGVTEQLARHLKMLPGVIEVGLFFGYPINLVIVDSDGD